MTRERPATASDMLHRLRDVAEPDRTAVLRSFFRTGPGEYGEGDEFIGVRVPAVRALAREFRHAPVEEVEKLLRSPVHEARLLALVLLVNAFSRADERGRRRIYDLYLSRTAFINSWDLVDVSAPHIVGAWLAERSRAILRRLARSKSLWERRIAILATHHFIRRGDLEDTFALADLLLDDAHDLIHKAVGWMLREAGDRDPAALRRFLKTRHPRMPRTMLRYAIEKFSERERRAYRRQP